MSEANMDMTAVPTRPKASDPAVVKAAAKALSAMLAEELADYEETEDALESLERALRYSRDGFRIGRDLDGDGWDVDAGMVEILDMPWLSDAHFDAVRDWVKTNDIRPKLAIGALVMFEGNRGEIVRIDDIQGTYTVFIEAIGHVRSGVGTHGRILTFEAVEGLPSAVSE